MFHWMFRLVVLLLLFGPQGLAATSDLWGRGGETWNPAGRLPDFSFAGYHFGEKPLPAVGQETDLRKFGAVGDGKTDCTDAFRRAIAATGHGAIFVPAGRYVIRDIIWIEKPNIVLRGAGPGKTTILPTNELEDVRPNMGMNTGGRITSNYSWSGGFLWVKGNFNEKPLSKVVSNARRGEHVLRVSDPARFSKGQRVVLWMTDEHKDSLISEVYSGDAGNSSKLKKPVRVRLLNRVSSVEGDKLTLDRPLRLNVDLKWKPEIRGYKPSVSEVGIEELDIEFPAKPYAGHFTERGMNGIAMNGVSDCWVRNVRILNSDSGVFLKGDCCTMDGVTLDSKRKPKSGATGHHGIEGGNDCLVTRFDFRSHFIHDITVSDWVSGSVFKNGRGVNLSLDHHKKGPFENLFCNIDAGDGRDLWHCGGGDALGKNCGARGTFWAIASKHPVSWPPKSFGPDSMVLVGLATKSEEMKLADGRWFETMKPTQLEPKDLHAAQLEHRLNHVRPR